MPEPTMPESTTSVAAAKADIEFFFDPVCPFCWVTSEWVREVQKQRDLEVTWRFISLTMLNEGNYDDKPEGYPDAHLRGLQMLRVAAAAKDAHGPEVMGELYEALGGAVWRADPPQGDDGFDDILAFTATAGDLEQILTSVGLPTSLAAAADDESWDAVIRKDTDEALERVGGDVGTPILSFSPPNGPAFFGPVISQAPTGEDALKLWDSVETLAHFPGFAELKRSLRDFPDTPVTAKIAGKSTTVS